MYIFLIPIRTTDGAENAVSAKSLEPFGGNLEINSNCSRIDTDIRAEKVCGKRESFCIG